MRYYTYNEPPIVPGGTPTQPILSEAQILAIYFPCWSKQMRKAGKQNLISFENCIKDWVVVHWAWEVLKPLDV